MENILQYISILIEVVIAVFGILIAFKRKKNYGFGIFFTFLIYTLYDLAKLTALNVSSTLLSFLFFLATLSAFWTVCILYKEHKRIRKVKPNKKRRRK